MDRHRRPRRRWHRRREQRAWYWYDWANSAYVTTVATVLFAPYLISVAEQAACGYVGSADQPCNRTLTSSGSPSRPARWSPTSSRSRPWSRRSCCPWSAPSPTGPRARSALLAGFAWAGTVAAALMFFVTGSRLAARRRAAVRRQHLPRARRWSSTTRSCCEIATPDERDRVSSRGWALGYLGGGLLLAAQPGGGRPCTTGSACRRRWRSG